MKPSTDYHTYNLNVGKSWKFVDLSRSAMLDRDIGTGGVSVCPSHVGNASKLITIGSRGFHQQVVLRYQLSDPGSKDLVKALNETGR